MAPVYLGQVPLPGPGSAAPVASPTADRAAVVSSTLVTRRAAGGAASTHDPDPPHAAPIRPRRGRRVRSATALALVTAFAAFAAGCTPAAGPAATTGTAGAIGATSAHGSGPTGSSTALAAQASTRAFGAQVDAATAAFVGAVGALQADTGAGATMAARSDELAAQADYDAFRALESSNAVNGSTLDELSTDVGALESFGGLHAVERDLWTVGPLAADVSGLAAQAPVAQFLLGRERLGPEAVGLVAVDQLNWVVDTALPVSQEQYAHLGLVDVAATEQAAHRTFSDIQPLAGLVDPSLTTTVNEEFAVLDAEVAALGDPTTVPDGSVPPTARLALSRQLDATASVLARLAATLTPYGTHGAPS